jgi:NAD(P)-dependent dehydrogenase (short-subunit alcohol dehydrogenase family)
MDQHDSRAIRAPSAPFENSRALIYGAATGIGRAVALEFARRGAHVAIADIKLDLAEEVAGQIEAAGGKATAIACDVSQRDSVHAAAAEAERRLGELDIVMNNVGGIINGAPQDIPVEEWRRIIDLNLFPVVYSNEVFIPKMLARGRGHIVNTGSFAGLYPFGVNRMPYVASKAAVIALSESMAIYLHPQGVRVSCLCPGPVKSNIVAGMKSWSDDIPFRGPGSQYRLFAAEEAAVILADGMRDGRVIIPTDEQVWEDVRLHAASPDAFIQRKIEAFSSGDSGLTVKRGD